MKKFDTQKFKESKTGKQIQAINYLIGRRLEAVIFLAIFLLLCTVIGSKMGANNMIKTIMYTAHDLLINTVFYLMAVVVLSSALGQLFIEFGVVRLLEGLLAPLMKPLFNLPGVASLGGLMTFFSDNPAIISLAKDKNFNSYFKKYELISLTNFGTAFGMGLLVISFMIGVGYFSAAIIGFGGAIIGSIISTRMMQYLIKDRFGDEEVSPQDGKEHKVQFQSKGSVGMRFLNGMLDGGKAGVELGLAIIPGVLIITTTVMLFTLDCKSPDGVYSGLAYEGVPILPYLAEKVGFIFRWLFGFENAEAIAFPMTALGTVGGALSLIPTFIEKGIVHGNEIAVFTAMGMCWSGYLSTHTAMLDILGYRELTSKALLSHTIGGLFAGIFAHYGFVLFQYITG